MYANQLESLEWVTDSRTTRMDATSRQLVREVADADFTTEKITKASQRKKVLNEEYKSLQPSVQEKCEMLGLAILFMACLFGIIYSCLLISMSKQHLRESEIEEFEQVEKLWSQTYLEEMKSINVSIIHDVDLYEDSIREIRNQEILVQEHELRYEQEKIIAEPSLQKNITL